MSTLVLYPENFELVPTTVLNALHDVDVILDGEYSSIELRFCIFADPARARDVERPVYTWRYTRSGVRIPGGTLVREWVERYAPTLLWSID